MDDARIKQLTQEVLSQIRTTETQPAQDLESRLTALEAAVTELRAALSVTRPAAPTTIQVYAHPSQQVLDVAGGSEHCVVEHDKECTGSGQCRSLGH